MKVYLEFRMSLITNQIYFCQISTSFHTWDKSQGIEKIN